MAWVWIDKNVVLAIHNEQIAEHGGQSGVRDEGLLESALARPLNKQYYETKGVTDLAAAYGYGLSKNHPFLDGNKRTAFVAVELFLMLNGWELKAEDTDCLQTVIALADGTLSEKELAAWLKDNVSKI